MTTPVGRVEARVAVALETLLKVDAKLLVLDASERAIAHRLACHLTDVFPGWDVDCEYNRDRHEPKALRSLPAQFLNSKDERRAFPDIVVHRRGTDDNLLVVEVKKTTNHEPDEYDQAKLRAYKADLGYQTALFVRFATGVDAPTVAEQRWVEGNSSDHARRSNRSTERTDPVQGAFLGIDLAWGESNSTGLAALQFDEGSLRLIDAPRSAVGPLEVLSFVRERLNPITVAAIDAPLIVANSKGQRPCETEIARLFGKAEASPHSTNLAHDSDPAGVRLARALMNLGPSGFSHPPADQVPMAQPCRIILEVYPHPAQVRLFRLARTLKYKKATGPGRRTALKDYRTRLLGVLQDGGLAQTPASQAFFGRDLSVSGRLKEYEDQLDAVFCALLAYRFWRFGSEGTEIIGDLVSGYIAVPRELAK